MTTGHTRLAAKATRRVVPVALIGSTLGLLLLGTGLFVRARGDTNEVALSATAKGVTVVEATAATYRPTRRYIGTVEPWLSARVGPQLISAFVDTVLVRPGAHVKRGQVLATLDCRNASALEKAVSMQARALEATQSAIANEAERVTGLLDGGYASVNEVELKKAESTSKQAQLLSLQAQMLGSSLQVSDCLLRAPFDGEVAERQADPGAFVRPGTTIVTVVDRSKVRVTADVPESDFEAVAPETPVKLHLLATGVDVVGALARRAPAADVSTRTIHVEIDLPNAAGAIPVGTTAELTIDVGEPAVAVALPIVAASVRGKRANVFVVDGDVAHQRALDVMGESLGRLFVAPESLSAGSQVVTLGRSQLRDGDKVASAKEVSTSTQARAAGRP